MGSLGALSVILRWVSLAGGLAWAAAGSSRSSPTVIASGVVLLAFAAWRTKHPGRSLGWTGAWAAAPWDELVLALGAVVLTGGWRSPFVVVLASPIAAAGLLAGLAQSGAMVALATVAIGLVELFGPGGGAGAGAVTDNAPNLGLSWCTELVLLGVIGACSRRLASQASAEHLEATTHLASQLEALTRANELLVELHQLDGAIPATRTTSEVVTAALGRLAELAAPDTAVIVLSGLLPGTWTVGASIGIELAPVLADADLPVPMTHCTSGEATVRNRRGPALSLNTRSAVYAPLLVGSRCLGIVALEWSLAGDRHKESELVRRVALQCAITLDNARLVAGLRSAGADDERHRIAERLHDDVGQDLAVLALTLDRVWTGLGREPALDYRDAVDELRREARRILGHVRETLADLRTNVTDEHDLSSTLESFLARVAARSHTSVALDAAEGRAPITAEREVWRIAQQAIIHAERDAGADHIEVTWRPGPGPAVLEVRDDGMCLVGGGVSGVGGSAGGVGGGPGVGAALRLPEGLLAMGERAALIGAYLEFESEPDRWTVVRCRLG